MRRLLILISTFYLCSIVQAQEYLGVHSSPYLPFIGIVNQPAELVRSDARWAINVLSSEVALLNNQTFASSDFWDVMSKVGFHDLKYFLGSEESLLYVNGRLMLPSVSYKINENHAVGLTISVRADGVYNASNDDFINLFKGIHDPESLKEIKDEHFKSLVNSWVEYGLTWSGTILKSDNKWLTGGVVLKILSGSGSGYLEMDGIDVMFDKERIERFDMKMSYAFNESLNKTIDGGDIVERAGDLGLGVDLGLSYSYLPEHLRGVKDVPYKYKIGFVMADFGSIWHSKTKNKASYQVNMNDVPYSRFAGIETLEALKDSIEKSVDIKEFSGGSFSTKLPFKIALNADYCLKPKWFANASLVVNPGYYNSTVDITRKVLWKASFTGRYETKKWGAYLPVNYSSAIGWKIGLATRYRQFFIGSSTVIGNLLGVGGGKQSVYFGFSVPIYSSDN
ncbi:hypothetical protein J1N10_13440 [Carboxylicivirga sp. A043]|uniref:DUF5723 family protein n=1 Tax=Carboxylicivirga litoralis TaxID=2816963 RepID=UPI0021CB37B2|nr:DUF5723 family protein [Carboxylicivirga sp. A043]MCU4156987.1 hypothetical protein [Carboxylicivirga sp. A043]